MKKTKTKMKTTKKSVTKKSVAKKSAAAAPPPTPVRRAGRPTKRRMKPAKVVEFVAAAPREWTVDVDSPSDVVPTEVAERLAGAGADRPDISAFPPALDEEGRPLFSPGDRIVIERYAFPVLEDNRWLDTHVHKVETVDPKTGTMRLWNETLGRWSYDNFITGPKVGQVYRMATRRLAEVGKRRGRRPKLRAEAPAPAAPGVKKKRGRPPGSKNRPKEVVAAERAERMEKVRAKRVAKEARKARGGR